MKCCIYVQSCWNSRSYQKWKIAKHPSSLRFGYVTCLNIKFSVAGFLLCCSPSRMGDDVQAHICKYACMCLHLKTQTRMQTDTDEHIFFTRVTKSFPFATLLCLPSHFSLSRKEFFPPPDHHFEWVSAFIIHTKMFSNACPIGDHH